MVAFALSIRHSDFVKLYIPREVKALTTLYRYRTALSRSGEGNFKNRTDNTPTLNRNLHPSMKKGEHWLWKHLHDLQITMKNKETAEQDSVSRPTAMVCDGDQYFYQVVTFDVCLKMHCLKNEAKLNPGIMFLIEILAGSTLVDYYDFEKYSYIVEEASQTPQQQIPTSKYYTNSCSGNLITLNPVLLETMIINISRV